LLGYSVVTVILNGLFVYDLKQHSVYFKFINYTTMRILILRILFFGRPKVMIHDSLKKREKKRKKKKKIGKFCELKLL
jgi:hypothetical protein